MPAAYISYAWGDDESPEGIEREAIVDDLCRSFAEAGIVIGRDKNEVKIGDSIEAFGERIAKAPLILAVISHRSLRSEWCMLYELYAAYTRRGGVSKEFAEDVVALVLDDALPDLKNRKALIAHWKDWCIDLEEELGEADPYVVGSLESRKVLVKCQAMVRSLPDMLLSIRRIAMPRGSASIRRDDFGDIIAHVKGKLRTGHPVALSTSLSHGMASLAIDRTVASRESAAMHKSKTCDAVALFLAQSVRDNCTQTSYEWKAFIRWNGEAHFLEIPNSSLCASATYAKKDLPKLLQCLRSWMAIELEAEALLDLYVPLELLDEDWGSFCVEGGKSKKLMHAYQPYLLRSADRLLKRKLNIRQAALRHMHIHLHDGTGIWLPSEHADHCEVIENLSGQALGEEDVASAICFLQSDIARTAKSRSAWIKTMLNSALNSMAPLVVWPLRKCSLDDRQVHLCLSNLSINKPPMTEGETTHRPHCPDQPRLAEARRRLSVVDRDIRGLQILVDHPDRTLDRAMLQAFFPLPREDTPLASKAPAGAAPAAEAAQPAPQLQLFISP